jgi:hypothetical protein
MTCVRARVVHARDRVAELKAGQLVRLPLVGGFRAHVAVLGWSHRAQGI